MDFQNAFRVRFHFRPVVAGCGRVGIDCVPPRGHHVQRDKCRLCELGRVRQDPPPFISAHPSHPPLCVRARPRRKCRPANVAPRECFYPIPDSSFDIDTYLGVWYQVAGYTAIFDAGCKCITANYTLNNNGTVHVVNECQELGLPVSIEGTAAAADTAYGEAGVFEVTLAGFGDVCPGPNYIVQGEFYGCCGGRGRRGRVWV